MPNTYQREGPEGGPGNVSESGEFIGPALVGAVLCFTCDIALCGTMLNLMGGKPTAHGS